MMNWLMIRGLQRLTAVGNRCFLRSQRTAHTSLHNSDYDVSSSQTVSRYSYGVPDIASQTSQKRLGHGPSECIFGHNCIMGGVVD